MKIDSIVFLVAGIVMAFLISSHFAYAADLTSVISIPIPVSDKPPIVDKQTVKYYDTSFSKVNNIISSSPTVISCKWYNDKSALKDYKLCRLELQQEDSGKVISIESFYLVPKYAGGEFYFNTSKNTMVDLNGISGSFLGSNYSKVYNVEYKLFNTTKYTGVKTDKVDDKTKKPIYVWNITNVTEKVPYKVFYNYIPLSTTEKTKLQSVDNLLTKEAYLDPTISACGDLTAGTYTITSDLTVDSSYCLGIIDTNVIIDGGYHKIVGTNAGLYSGIYANFGFSGLSISNLNITGFGQGIYLYPDYTSFPNAKIENISIYNIQGATGSDGSYSFQYCDGGTYDCSAILYETDCNGVGSCSWNVGDSLCESGSTFDCGVADEGLCNSLYYNDGVCSPTFACTDGLKGVQGVGIYVQGFSNGKINNVNITNVKGGLGGASGGGSCNNGLNNNGVGLWFDSLTYSNISNIISTDSDFNIYTSGSTANNILSNLFCKDTTGTNILIGGTNNSINGAVIKNNTAGNALYLLGLISSDLNNISIDKTGGFGIYYVSGSNYNRLSNISMSNLGVGMIVSSGSYSNFTSMKITNTTGRGLWMSTGIKNIFNYVNVTNATTASGIGIDDSGTNTTWINVVSNNNTLDGIRFTADYSGNMTNITTNGNNQSGIRTVNVNMRGVTINNVNASYNKENGIILTGIENSSLNDINVNYNNGSGLFISNVGIASVKNNITNLVAVENNGTGITSTSARSIYTNLTVINNSQGGIILNTGTLYNTTISNVYLDRNAKLGGISFYTSNARNINIYNIFINNSFRTALQIAGGFASPLNTTVMNVTIQNTNTSFNDLLIPFQNNVNFSIDFIDYYIKNYSILTSGFYTFKKTGASKIAFNKPVNESGANLTKDIYEAYNFAEVNGSINNFNKSANVTFYGLPTNMKLPVILKNGVLCLDCANFSSLNSGNPQINVSSWSNYSIFDSFIPPAADTVGNLVPNEDTVPYVKLNSTLVFA